MKFEYLADHQELMPILADWYFKEWGYLKEGHTIDLEIKRLQEYLNKNEIPLILLAIEGDELLGAAQLKYREMSIYPDKEHWLGGVFVSDKHRGKGVAKLLIEELLLVAQQMGVHKLFLQTEQLDGGLYARMGWMPLEQVNYHDLDVLVMERNI
ncbi:MAG: GNAT family N-acetyltransferase [Aureispira sp.]|nr:GNAT family N-acetyltransferase [Aureispira sp.]